MKSELEHEGLELNATAPANICQILGLSNVQRLMELPGGNCGYAPRLDRGSCFYVTLPVP